MRHLSTVSLFVLTSTSFKTLNFKNAVILIVFIVLIVLIALITSLLKEGRRPIDLARDQAVKLILTQAADSETRAAAAEHDVSFYCKAECLRLNKEWDVSYSRRMVCGV